MHSALPAAFGGPTDRWGTLESRLPAHVARAMWRGRDLGCGPSDVLPSGFAMLDAELPGGGWPTRNVIEVLQAAHQQAEWRLLSPVLARLMQRGAPLFLVAPPHVPGLQGLHAEGVPARQVIWVQAHTHAERLWATEQALKAGGLSAVLAWLPQARPEQLRRLQACAGRHPGLCVVFRPMVAQAEASAAPLRLRLELGPWPSPLQVQLLKRRGPLHEQPLALARWPAGLKPLLPTLLPLKRPIPGPAVPVAVPAEAGLPAREPSAPSEWPAESPRQHAVAVSGVIAPN
ncbi:MAG: translesion DNA synthesis-associated protein ImuA [Aquabacterium sp.]|uniref:translesion DNA synthesis-associated protein ImuA n=2 Tax=Aquabacterium TaxID=92793 RepID=UPI0035C67FBB